MPSSLRYYIQYMGRKIVVVFVWLHNARNVVIWLLMRPILFHIGYSAVARGFCLSIWSETAITDFVCVCV